MQAKAECQIHGLIFVRQTRTMWGMLKIITTVNKYYGCILVPIGPKEIENNELLWRISFSMAEKQLSHALN
jgi:hypothetical protein